MKKFIYIIIVTFLLFTIFFLTLGLAAIINKCQMSPKVIVKEGKELTIFFVPKIDNVCKRFSVKTTIGGCYIAESSLIYINTKINFQDISYVLTHEIGHWLTEHKDMRLFNNDWEKAADSFSNWVLNKRVDLETKEYFNKIWSNLSL